jgi:TRAP-type C4-dicarboxylate transport system permease small subunit
MAHELVQTEKKQPSGIILVIAKVSLVCERIVSYTCATLVLTMFLITIYQVIARTLGIVVSWTDELSRFLLIWIAIFAASIAFKRGAHIGIDFIIDRFSAKGRTIINILNMLITMIFIALFFKLGIATAKEGLTVLSTALLLPMFWVKISLPIGSVFIMVSILEIIVNNIQSLLERK